MSLRILAFRSLEGLQVQGDFSESFAFEADSLLTFGLRVAIKAGMPVVRFGFRGRTGHYCRDTLALWAGFIP
jgi:hypothetical protein